MSKIVANYMVKDPIIVHEQDSFKSVYEKFRINGIDCAPVLNAESKLVGMISKTDLLVKAKRLLHETTGKTYSDYSLNYTTAAEIMSRDVVRVLSSDSIDLAIKILLQKDFHSLPVVNDNNKVMGIISSFDLLKGYYQKFG